MARRTARPVKSPSAFWDTSALVLLCVRQGTTPRATALYENFEAVIWWATSVEIASVLARLVRMKQLNSSDWAKAGKIATALASDWSVIQPLEAVRAKATELVDRYDLRAADALQLAAALAWCEDIPQGRVFLTADQKLQEAALLSGFDAKQI
jgi:predicted nucleic acid-binding protein